MDFGIAKQSGSAAERGLTQAGVFVGTVDYAAPEQIEAKEITTAADIYAFGGVLYEALTGKKPYERDTDVAVMFAHITEPPPAVTKVAARAARGARRGDRARDGEGARGAVRDLPRDDRGRARRARRQARRPRPARRRLLEDAAPAAPAVTSNLPEPATPLVGRDDELAEVVALLEQPAVRLVTLTGSAARASRASRSRPRRRCATSYAEDVLRRPLAGAATPTSSAPRSPTCSASARRRTGRSRRSIAERLADRPTLIVLDNFEERAAGGDAHRRAARRRARA